MKRRQLLLGSGATLGGASILGTGAFTSVRAERSVTVNVAADADAFLRLAPCDENGGYVTGAGSGTMAIDLTEDNNVDGSGVNPEARSVFDNVFEIANQGTQDVCVDFEVEVPQIPSDASVPGRYEFGSGDPAVVFYRGSDRNRYVINNRLDTDRDGAIKLPIDEGNAECIGFEVRAFGFDSDEDLFSGVDLTIRADADAECTGPGEIGDVADPTPIGPTDGLVGYWPLDDLSEGALNVIDSYPNISSSSIFNDGTIAGDVESTSGKVGGAALFNSNSDESRIELPIGFSSPDEAERSFDGLTISAWIRPNNLSGDQRIFARDEAGGGDQAGYAISLGDPSDGEVRFYSRAMDIISLDTSGSPIETEDWTHVLGTYDSNEQTRRIYIDGTEQATLNDDTGTWSGAGRASIGGEAEDSPEFGNRRFDGRIDDVRVYKRALSANEVTSLYRATNG